MFIKRLAVKKLLSFNDSTIELGQLNVLIGPNAVGKSNLLEVIGLLQAAPTGLAGAILRGGGIRQWLWLGDSAPSPLASIECELLVSSSWKNRLEVGTALSRVFVPVNYELRFSEDARGFVILGERIWSADSSASSHVDRSVQSARIGPKNFEHSIDLSQTESVLSQFKSPMDTTPATEIGNRLAQIRIMREFRTGFASPARYGISTSASKDFLADGGDNLALVLHDMDFLGVHERIRGYLRRFCERFEDAKVSVGEGLARTFLREAGLLEMLSSIRMSDGTLKFLSLLAALFYPNKPPLLCIDEPEAGLHPDALHLVAEALIEASESTQLIVTTHSDALVDALTDRPECVLVCERDFDNGTQVKRLSGEDLKEWLQHYTLGQLWRKGEIGGGRW